MKAAKISHWSGIKSPYSYSHNLTENEEVMLEKLEDILPHGSGINGDWSFDILKNGNIVCHNTYEAMNEGGYYCHFYDFSVTVKTLENDKFQWVKFSFKGNKEHSCCGWGLQDYLADTLSYSLE